MQSSQQSNRETHRVIVLGANGTELLVAAGNRSWLLPSVDIPCDQRLAQCLTTALNRRWGCAAVCLSAPDIPSSTDNASRTRYEVMECVHRTHDFQCKWVPIPPLLPEDFADTADFNAVQQAVAGCNTHERGGAPGPFARIGWFGELRAWVEEVVAPLGFRLRSGFSQLNASPSFSLIRFETSGPAIWFKAVSEPNLSEFPITLMLSDLVPKYVPALLASRSAWRGWIAREVEGANLGQTRELRGWKNAASSLAQMQIESIGHGPRLLHCGARDLRASALANLVDPFLDAMDRLMAQQFKVPPPVLTRKDLVPLGEQVLDALSLLLELGVPDALGHLDLNPGNIIMSADDCVFLDWAEAYVGHPFLSFQYLLEHFRRSTCADPLLEGQLTTSYANAWLEILSADVIAEAFRLAPMLAVFAYAAGAGMWADAGRLKDQKSAGYLRSLTRRLHGEANLTMQRRLLCLG